MATKTTMTVTTSKVQIPDRLYFRIGDVAELLGVKPYVLRYWESEFPMISPQKSPSGQRVYRRGDVETVLMIKHLLYEERYSVEGAKKRIKELRKEGELKGFKDSASKSEENEPAALSPTPNTQLEFQAWGDTKPDETLGAAVGVAGEGKTAGSKKAIPAVQPIKPIRKEELQKFLLELDLLAQTPISDLFLY